jgi:hypothetical protein
LKRQRNFQQKYLRWDPHPEERVVHARLEGWVFISMVQDGASALPGVRPLTMRSVLLRRVPQHFEQHLCCRNRSVRLDGGSFVSNLKHFQQLAVLAAQQAGLSMLHTRRSKAAT